MLQLTLPKRVSIIGAGKSIDDLEPFFSPIPYIIGINAAALIFDVQAASVLDLHMMGMFKERLAEDVLIFNQNTAIENFDYQIDCSSIMRGTGCLTFTINCCAAMGVKEIDFYGIDSYFDQYEYSNLALGYGLAVREPEMYKLILQSALKALVKNQINGTFHYNDKSQRFRGKDK